MRQTKFWSHRLSLGSPEEAASELKSALKIPGFHTAITFNPQMAMGLQAHPELKAFFDNAAYAFPDGRGITWALKYTKGIHTSRITGIDLIEQLFKDKTLTFYLIGSSHAHIQLAKAAIAERGTRVLGFHHGYLSTEDTASIIADLKAKRPDIILVGMGFPRQEQFLLRLQMELTHGIGMGVGGSFDVLAGEKKRAPLWMQNWGLEWVYRGLTEPQRLKTWGYMIPFVWKVLKSKRDSL